MDFSNVGQVIYSEKSWYKNIPEKFSFDTMIQSTNRFFNQENFNTQLSPTEQGKFNSWVSQMKATPSPSGNGTVIHKDDTFSNYDMQGYWKDNVSNNASWKPDAKNGHFTDYYKKPNHPTFSTESKYATGTYKQYAGSWHEAGKGNHVFMPAKATVSYMNKNK